LEILFQGGKAMPVVTIIGAQWGDEGKGKIVDMLAEKAHMVVRFSGGDNAGHTIINPQGKFALRLVPSGIFYPQATCIIGNGVAVNPAVLIEEMESINKRGVDTSRLFISDRANLIMPYHVMLDALEEKFRGGKAIGTTGKGIGPVFSDKLARWGIRAGDLLNTDAFRERLRAVLDYKNAILTRLYGEKPLSLEEVYDKYCEYGKRLTPLIKDTTVMIDHAVSAGKNVLFEGAQGTLLDPDFGTYPFGTSCSSIAGQSSIGSGIGPTRINFVLGVFKAYITRVGAGPMPTILKDDTGNLIRERGHEYGTVSGRARDCGWFDAVAARYTTRVNGFTGVAVTRLDVLDSLPSLKICTGYKLGGSVIDYFPASLYDLGKCQPVYEEMPGWQAPLSDIRSYNKLPDNAKKYLARLEELSGFKIKIVSVGANREQTILKESVW
jgi:adenylosuccinate synthase